MNWQMKEEKKKMREPAICDKMIVDFGADVSEKEERVCIARSAESR